MRGRKPNVRPIDGALKVAPKPPAWLPAEAKAEWKRVAPHLVARKVLTEDSLATLEAYALAVGTIRRMQKTIAREGDTVSTSAGIRRHPAFQTMSGMMTEARRLAAELAITPASRGKAGDNAPAPNADDESDPYAALGIEGTAPRSGAVQ